MKNQDIKNILKTILLSLPGEEFFWHVDGSANLKIQGLDVSADDLDITTDDEGIQLFRESLEQFIVRDFYSEKIKGSSLICDIDGFEVEINSYGDRPEEFIEEARMIKWRGLSFPILPLLKAKELYSPIGRTEKVNLIEDFLSEN